MLPFCSPHFPSAFIFIFAKVHLFEDFSEKSGDSKLSELIYVRKFILFLFCPHFFFFVCAGSSLLHVGFLQWQ